MNVDKSVAREYAELLAGIVRDFKVTEEVAAGAVSRAARYLGRTETPGVTLIADERRRQVEKEGWLPEHDDRHTLGELAMAAACYAAPRTILVMDGVAGSSGSSFHFFDPWPKGWDDKRGIHQRERCLVIAGALCAAELDRIQRARDVKASKAAGWCSCGAVRDPLCKTHGD